MYRFLGLAWYFRSNRREVNHRHPIAMYTLAQNARLQAETERVTVACDILESKRQMHGCCVCVCRKKILKKCRALQRIKKIMELEENGTVLRVHHEPITQRNSNCIYFLICI